MFGALDAGRSAGTPEPFEPAPPTRHRSPLAFRSSAAREPSARRAPGVPVARGSLEAEHAARTIAPAGVHRTATSAASCLTSTPTGSLGIPRSRVLLPGERSLKMPENAPGFTVSCARPSQASWLGKTREPLWEATNEPAKLRALTRGPKHVATPRSSEVPIPPKRAPRIREGSAARVRAPSRF